ncbi:histidine phosphatase family protein [Bordetella sp. FB-8]|uniref:histidine phosphatase family protein n=1 Tax=Bordetella sp. FB-8 TaxID=1159870 RepID=UPI00037412CD|nr:histidine phosphatase family protein [Bordetella sp. FB-8]
MSEFWFVRHGETDWNRERRLQGWQDIPLNDTGLSQAARLARRLREDAMLIPFAALYSSDLRRARATAQAVSAATGLPVHIEHGIRERNFGVLEGLQYETLDQTAPEAAAAWRSRDPDRVLKGGESLGGFNSRVLYTIEALARRHTGHRVLVVTHGGALDIIWRRANGIALSEPRHTRMANAAINRVCVDDGGWHVLDWGDDSHIAEPARDGVV